MRVSHILPLVMGMPIMRFKLKIPYVQGPMPPKRLNKTSGGPQAWVEVTHVSQRALKIPHYSSKENKAVCLGQLASVCRTAIRVPLNMLRAEAPTERRVLDSVSSSSTDRSVILIQRKHIRQLLEHEVDNDSDNDENLLEQEFENDSDNDEKAVEDIKDWELEKLRAVKKEYKKTHPKLSPPPPHFIERYSAVLGDGFHYMDRQEMQHGRKNKKTAKRKV